MVACDYIQPLNESVHQLARLAFAEDLPAGDVTANALNLSGKRVSARVMTRQSGIMVGECWLQAVLDAFQPYAKQDMRVTAKKRDGAAIQSGDVLFDLQGDSADLLAFERTFLNFLGRGMGIAIKTKAFVDLVRSLGCNAAVLDTRKTLPGFRYFDKYAVLCGGGQNHRMNLSDQVLIKENHIASFGGVAEAVQYARERTPKQIPIEIEVQNFDQLRQALDAGCRLIMLDNFKPVHVHEACSWPRNGAEFEVSGGISLENISHYCHPTLDRISIGSLTHSVKAPDITLLVNEEAS